MACIKYYNSDISILAEYYRYDLLQTILDDIKHIYNTIYATKLDNYKSKKINLLISLWIMNQYASYTPSNDNVIPDPLLPYGCSNHDQLINNLINLNLTHDITDTHHLILKWDLTAKFMTACTQMTKYLESTSYTTLKSTCKYNIINLPEKSITEFVIITDQRAIKLFHKLPNIYTIPTVLYNTLKSIRKYDDLAILIMLMRYYTLDSDNQQLAIHPELYNELISEYPLSVELFASGLNCSLKSYCSLFPDIERGSLGYFHLLQPVAEIDNIFVANPPFDENIMYNMSRKFIEWLSGEYSISIVLTIPQWGAYGTFATYELLNKSGFIRYQMKIDKLQAKFFNYMKYKAAYPCNIYYILLQNNAGYETYPKLIEKMEKLKLRYLN